MKRFLSIFLSFYFFNLCAVISEEKAIVIVIPSYNNEQWCIKNISCALNQNYENFRIIFIDDCSSDTTFELVRSYVTAHPRASKVVLIHNEQRVGALENLYNAIHSCADYEVVVMLDGDDWPLHENVLSRVNQEYQNPDVWLTYGQFVWYPSGRIGYCAPIPADVINAHSFRSHPWLTSHLRTFYAGLFKKVKKEDLLLDGKFYPVTWDQAMLLPMLEMSGSHIRFIPDVLYVYNYNNPLNDERTLPAFCVECEQQIRHKPSYARLDQLILHGPDLIIFSYDRPLQLYALLESVNLNMQDLSSCTVIYRSSDAAFDAGYEKVKEQFSCAHFKKQLNPPHDFKQLVLESCFNTKSPYVMFAVDDIVVKETVSTKACLEKMEHYHAYAFFLRLGLHLTYCYSHRGSQPLPAHQVVEDSYCLWTFNDGSDDWKYPHSVDMTIYRKSEIAPYLTYLNYHSPNGLEWEMAARGHNVFGRQGMCALTTGIVNIPLNVVTQGTGNPHMNWQDTAQLLHHFNQGKKIDIMPLQHIKNASAHIHYEPQLINR